jgi:hypothetical protein
VRSYIIYREESDYARAVIEYVREFERRVGRAPELISPDTKQGSDFCQVYDIVQYPTVIATDDDGVMQNMWSGLPLPTINEVSYYA